ncbi:PREDICTED: uncharacterized protein LOC108355971 [Rhagoletis zephyria]|uniref:uncharacterized protein LOC108355971 n=1 Tax=Rhagoletis zephyria TaxID=28612 RepID=UPI0008115672|nr:PREDICTED: uncharacterized protein LOC108355971 [Rhagoletis zephyria]
MDKKPEKFPCTLRVRTHDTFLKLAEHEDVRRPTRHLKRLKIGEAAFNEGAGNYRKREAASYASTCTRLPAHLPKLSVIRQCKSDYLQQKYGVKPEDNQDVVLTIERMRHDPEYPKFIHDVQREPFFVAYSTPEQLHCYKRFNKLCRDSCNISIDGTGSIVQSIVNPISGVRMGHIPTSISVNVFKNNLK